MTALALDVTAAYPLKLSPSRARPGSALRSSRAKPRGDVAEDSPWSIPSSPAPRANGSRSRARRGGGMVRKRFYRRPRSLPSGFRSLSRLRRLSWDRCDRRPKQRLPSRCPPRRLPRSPSRCPPRRLPRSPRRRWLRQPRHAAVGAAALSGQSVSASGWRRSPPQSWLLRSQPPRRPSPSRRPFAFHSNRLPPRLTRRRRCIRLRASPRRDPDPRASVHTRRRGSHGRARGPPNERQRLGRLARRPLARRRSHRSSGPPFKATGYGVVLRRNGNRIFLARTHAPRLELPRVWRYRKTTFRLRPGRSYRWVVRPLLGTTKTRHFGRANVRAVLKIRHS